MVMSGKCLKGKDNLIITDHSSKSEQKGFQNSSQFCIDEVVTL